MLEGEGQLILLRAALKSTSLYIVSRTLRVENGGVHPDVPDARTSCQTLRMENEGVSILLDGVYWVLVTHVHTVRSDIGVTFVQNGHHSLTKSLGTRLFSR